MDVPITRRSVATWNGDLHGGVGMLSTDGGRLAGATFTAAGRIEPASGHLAPEELFAAAHASCVAMSLAATLSRIDARATRIEVGATCTLRVAGEGIEIARLDVEVRGVVPGLDAHAFAGAVEAAVHSSATTKALGPHVDVSARARLQDGGGTAALDPPTTDATTTLVHGVDG